MKKTILMALVSLLLSTTVFAKTNVCEAACVNVEQVGNSIVLTILNDVGETIRVESVNVKGEILSIQTSQPKHHTGTMRTFGDEAVVLMRQEVVSKTTVSMADGSTLFIMVIGYYHGSASAPSDYEVVEKRLPPVEKAPGVQEN